MRIYSPWNVKHKHEQQVIALGSSCLSKSYNATIFLLIHANFFFAPLYYVDTLDTNHRIDGIIYGKCNNLPLVAIFRSANIFTEKGMLLKFYGMNSATVPVVTKAYKQLEFFKWMKQKKMEEKNAHKNFTVKKKRIGMLCECKSLLMWSWLKLLLEGQSHRMVFIQLCCSSHNFNQLHWTIYSYGRSNCSNRCIKNSVDPVIEYKRTNQRMNDSISAPDGPFMPTHNSVVFLLPNVMG